MTAGTRALLVMLQHPVTNTHGEAEALTDAIEAAITAALADAAARVRALMVQVYSSPADPPSGIHDRGYDDGLEAAARAVEGA